MVLKKLIKLKRDRYWTSLHEQIGIKQLVQAPIFSRTHHTHVIFAHSAVQISIIIACSNYLPRNAALCNGVHLSLSSASIFAPSSIRARTVLSRPEQK